jgi:hypothetical protein
MFAKLLATAIHSLQAEFESMSKTSTQVCLMVNHGHVTPANKLAAVSLPLVQLTVLPVSNT